MSTFTFPDFPLQLAESANDDSHQHPPTPLGDPLLFSSAVDPSMLHHASSASPSLNTTHTPAESLALSIHYQSSEFSDYDFDNGDDGYFNANFNTPGGNAPSFLDDNLVTFVHSDPPETSSALYTTPEPNINGQQKYPLSPDQTPSLHTSSPQNVPIAAPYTASRNLALAQQDSAGVGLISPQQLTKQPLATAPSRLDFSAFGDSATQLTPDTASSHGSSGNPSRDSLSTEGGLASSVIAMSSKNPHVTVSVWGKDGGAPSVPSTDGTSSRANPALIGMSADDSVLPSQGAAGQSPVFRNNQGAWVTNAATGQGGIDPSSRFAAELPTSVNEDTKSRDIQKRNSVVDQWLTTAENVASGDGDVRSQEHCFEGVSGRDIEPGGDTRNVEQPGSTYFIEGGAPPNATDYELMLNGHIWDDAPRRLPITGDRRRQPVSSQAAIERFERMCQDNASILSRVATWGTRRRSLPSITDIEGVTSGNFLKKLSLSRGDTRRPSILEGLRGLVRKPSTTLKRTRSHQDDETTSNIEDRYDDSSPTESRRDSRSTLAPPSRTESWGKNKQPMPSINTALISMGSSVASIGTTHARNGSISRPHAGSVSLSPPLTSPKSPLLKVGNSFRRQRSNSELTKPTTENPHPNLVRMLKRSGGPPVASLATTHATATPIPGPTSAPTSVPISSPNPPPPIKIPATKVFLPDLDDDEDEDDDIIEDGDLKTESDELIDRISPDVNGFRELVLGLNPMLTTANTYLVDRIAYQQSQRYKALLNNKVRHLGHVKGRSCASGDLCIAQGGSAIILDSKGDTRGIDPLSTTYDPSDIDDMTSPLDGTINTESFPKYIPMPPTSTLPAEFECQLCFQNKRPQKPSDWTKHVHEDVQPFTCTWDRCRDPKIFKRKADWVRHENEGHRHLEWWTCDVDECRHTCYRRDNFLQHLVREHKFPEPKHKTKAAIKRAGASDPTWQRVEKCHAETKAKPQDEPCRFCGKSFPTWKKLTVHLAKHMEHISLPILRLVDRKDVDADTIISPVQDLPPRTFVQPPGFPALAEQPQHGMMGGLSTGIMSIPQGAVGVHQSHMPRTMAYTPAEAQNSSSFGYPAVAPVQFQQPYYGQPSFGVSTGLSGQMQNLDVAAAMDVASVGTGYASSQGYVQGHMPVTTGGGYLGAAPNQFISEPAGMDPSSYSTLSAINALGLQAPLPGGQMAYEVMVDPSVANSERYTPRGSASPYSHSPHQNQGQFY